MRSFALLVPAFLLLLASPVALANPVGKPKQVLFFSRGTGNAHAAITDGEPSLAQKALEALGAAHGFVVTHTKDGSVFTPEGIAKYDAFVFFTGGNPTAPAGDKSPPMPPEGKNVLLEAIAKGKGFVGIHLASTTFRTPGDRFAANGEATDPYIKMLGGEFIRHGQQQKAKLFCADRRFPGLTDCKDSELLEEWYSFKNLAPDLHVLLWLGTWSMKNTGGDSVYRRPPYPVTWAHMHGKGRVFYTALGHREDVWGSAFYQNMLAGGIRWASGQTPAVVKPNIAAVTPGYAELPPNDSPPPQPATAAAAKPPVSAAP